MAVNVIDTIKPKNSGTFPIVEATDVSVAADMRLPEALAAKANASDLAALQTQITTPFNFKGAVASTSDLPSTAELNDTYFVTDLKYRVTWNGTEFTQSSLDEGEYEDELSEISEDVDSLKVDLTELYGVKNYARNSQGTSSFPFNTITGVDYKFSAVQSNVRIRFKETIDGEDLIDVIIASGSSQIITIPSNTAYLLINYESPSGGVVKSEKTDSVISVIKDDISELQDDLSDLSYLDTEISLIGNTVNPDFVENTYIQSDGTEASLAVYSATGYIYCYRFGLMVRTDVADDSSRTAFYDANKKFISAYNAADESRTDTAITIPENASYVRFSCLKNYAESFRCKYIGAVPKVVELATTTEENTGKIEKTLTGLRTLGIYDIGFVDISNYNDGHYYTLNINVGETVNTTPSANASFGCQLIEVHSGDKYKVKGIGGQASRLYGITDTSYKLLSVASYSTAMRELELDIEEDGYLFVNAQIALSAEHSVYQYKENSQIKNQVNHNTDAIDDLKNSVDTLMLMTGFGMFQSVAGIGDSYTEGDMVNSGGAWVTKAGVNYLSVIGNRNGCDVKNYGSGGATTKTYQDKQKFEDALSDDPCELYIFALGQNDVNVGMTKGTIADIHDDYTENPDTFYGNYGKIIAQIMAHAPNARFIIVGSWINGTSSSSGIEYQSYNPDIEAIAEHFGFPYINPYDDTFFNSNFYNNNKSSGHPTAMGYCGMGIAMERLFSKCVVSNASYFKYALIG